MHAYQRDFIELAIARGALRFGDFTLKSGRTSPYFFNAGLFQTGRELDILGRAFAGALSASGIPVDTLFGPAYKGIPLVSATSIAFYRDYAKDIPWSFNRKEVKDHGEGGQLVGAPVRGNTVIIDDVITAGTAIREVIRLIDTIPEASLGGIAVALDREERGPDERSAIQALQDTWDIPVTAIITLTDLLDYLQQAPGQQDNLARVAAYRDRFGV